MQICGVDLYDCFKIQETNGTQILGYRQDQLCGKDNSELEEPSGEVILEN